MTKTNKQPKLFNIYKFNPNGTWSHISYIIARSRAHLITLYPQYNSKNYLIS